MVIVYKNQDETIGILYPVQEVLEALYASDINPFFAIAEKDVPAPYQYATAWDTSGVPTTFAEYNTPYWIVPASDIPTDRSQRNLWTWDSPTPPDGFGGQSNEFTEEQLQALYAAGVIQ